MQKKYTKILLVLLVATLLAAGCNNSKDSVSDAELRLADVKKAAEQLDFDKDGVSNLDDNCPAISNSDQKDSDHNDVGDACQEPKPNGQTQTRDNPNGPDYIPNQPTPTSVPKAPTITVAQTVEGSNLNKLSTVVPVGENAIDLLRRDHTIETESYGSIGEMVVVIDGIKPDTRHFWAFYVNGKSSNVGASSYKPKDQDKIEWKLEAIK